jgi:hypothetical protein
MKEFAFKVNLVAVVRVRAADERIARQVVPEVLGAPGSIEIGLTNQNVRAMGREATVTGVDFSIGRSSPRNEDAKPRWRRSQRAGGGRVRSCQPPDSPEVAGHVSSTLSRPGFVRGFFLGETRARVAHSFAKGDDSVRLPPKGTSSKLKPRRHPLPSGALLLRTPPKGALVPCEPLCWYFVSSRWRRRLRLRKGRNLLKHPMTWRRGRSCAGQ